MAPAVGYHGRIVVHAWKAWLWLVPHSGATRPNIVVGVGIAIGVEAVSL